MANHLQSLLKSLSIPSENSRIESKKDMDLFNKVFNKKKRGLTMKLNKQQINRSQVIAFHHNVLNALERVKKKRIDDIIKLCEDLFPNFICLAKEKNVEKVETFSHKRKLSEEDSINDSKKLKLIREENCLEKDNCIINDKVEICDVESKEDIIIDSASPLENYIEDDSSKNTLSIPVIEEIYIKSNNSTFPTNCLEIVNETVEKNVKQIQTMSRNQSIIKSVKVSNLINTPKSSTSKPLFLKPVKGSDIQTSQTKTPLFKNKFHNELNSKTKSLTKTQTPLVQKKTVAEIRKIQDQQAEERRQKIEEELKRKNAKINLATLKSTKNLITMKFQSNVVKQHAAQIPSAAKPFTQKTLKVNSNKMNSPEKMTSTLVNKTSTFSIDKAERITESSVLDKSLFKTPFAKKRITMLSNSCKKIIENHESFNLACLVDVDTDDEDEECERRKCGPVPKWCNKTSGTLSNLMKYQSKHWNPKNIFRNPVLVSIDMKTIFGESGRYKDYLEKWI